jgi:hypothetical protein
MLRLPGPRLGDPEPRPWLWPHTEPDAHRHSGDIVPLAARAHIYPVHAGDIPD